MFLFISIVIISIFILFLWALLIGANKSKSDEEIFVEDNLQMQYLRYKAVKDFLKCHQTKF